MEIKMNELVVHQIADGIYRFQEKSEFICVDSYLIIGNKKAVMIDGLGAGEGLLEKAKAITNKPVSMIITHGHYDHIGNGLKEFMDAGLEIYFPFQDYYMLEELYGEALSNANIQELVDGMTFSLGDCTLRAIAAPGHTQGSTLLYLQERNFLFTGDAIGSGNIWMQLPRSSKLTSYREELTKILHFLEKNEGMKIYPGHSCQIKPYLVDEQDYLECSYVSELAVLTDKIISGELVGKDIEISMDIAKGIQTKQIVGKLVGEYCYDCNNIV